MSTQTTSRRPKLLLAAAALGGLGLGVLTVIGQKALPDTVTGVANSGVVWAFVAFVAGAFAATDLVAAVVGAEVLLGAVIGYYASVPILVEGAAANVRSVVIWGIVAVTGGPAVGVAGRWWGSDSRSKRLLASGIAGGAFAGEGLRRFTIEPPDVALGWAMLAVGLLIPLVRPQPWRDRLAAIALLAVAVIGITAVFWLIDAVFAA